MQIQVGSLWAVVYDEDISGSFRRKLFEAQALKSEMHQSSSRGFLTLLSATERLRGVKVC